MDFPNGTIKEVRRTLTAAVGSTASPFSLREQVQDWGGRRWDFEIDVIVNRGAEQRRFEAFVNNVINPRSDFVFTDPTMKQARNSAPVVHGNNQGGKVLSVRGLTDALVVGDFLSLGSAGTHRLHQVIGSTYISVGRYEIRLNPPLRQSPRDGDRVEIAAPSVTLRSTESVLTRIGPGERGYTINAREIL